MKKFTASIIFLILCEDLTFHFAHKFLHQKWIYPYIHKKHHDYHVTVSISSDYSHPAEFYIAGLLPSSVGGLLLGNSVHLSTMLMFGLMRTFESIDGHTGYEFPWSPYRMLPFSASTEYHDYHHSHNVGNYSSFFTVLDTLFGCDRDYHINC